MTVSFSTKASIKLELKVCIKTAVLALTTSYNSVGFNALLSNNSSLEKPVVIHLIFIYDHGSYIPCSVIHTYTHACMHAYI